MERFCPRSPLVLAAVLLLGVALGVALDRGAPHLSAQKRDGAATANPAAVAPSRSVLARGSDENAIYDQLARQYERFEHVNRTFELVSKAVSPAVVHIVAQKSTKHGQRQLRFEETGSGVIVRPEKDGPEYVLTNNHVVDGAPAAEIDVFLHDGRVLHPDRAWSDAKADIAVLRLAVGDLPSARLGNSDDVVVGTWVLALGSPFGLTHSVSQGIISARNRHEQELQDDGVDNQDFLQTDAAINPGNSGGPLVNLKGEVIGINTAIASNGGGSEGVGFSIPINLARWIMGQLISKGRVHRGAMGVNLDDLTAARATAVGLDRPRGAQVRDVHIASPAALADLRKGDIVLKFNGVDVINLNHLINLVAMAPIGQPAEVVLWRDQRELGRSVTVADLDRIVVRNDKAAGDAKGKASPARSVPARAQDSESMLGLDLVTVDAVTAKRLGFPESTWGVGVLRVDVTSPMASSLQPMDVIYAVGGRSVRSLDDLSRAVSLHKGSVPLELWVQRPASGQRFTVKVP